MIYMTRVTKLQAFNLFRSADWFDSDRLIEQLSDKQEENERMRLGTTFHSMIENRPLIYPDHPFSYDSIKPINSLAVDSAREVEGSLTIELEQCNLIVSGHADAITGSTVIDYKTSTKEPDLDMYIDSYQWRFYLWMFDARCFKYEFFRLKEDKKTGLYNVEHLTPVKLYRYAGLELDCINLAQDYVNTLETIGGIL